jgi:uncharacterized membrane protein YccC
MKFRAAQRTSYRMMLLLQRRLSGLRYAIRMLISGVIVWLILAAWLKLDPLWGLISSVVVTEVKVQSAWNAFVSRLLNTAIGCMVALVFLKFGGATEWSVLGAMAVSIIVSADLVKVPISWRIAPITAAIVMLPAYTRHSAQLGLTAALQRTYEVIIGSAVAVGVSYATAGLFRWRPARAERQPQP